MCPKNRFDVKLGKHILIVDDETIVLDVMSDMLKRMGCQTLLAKSGKEAIDIFSSQGDQISLVILDLILQDMESIAVFKALKAIDLEINIIISSGYSSNNYGDMLPDGIAGFLQKPFGTKALSSILNATLLQTQSS